MAWICGPIEGLDRCVGLPDGATIYLRFTKKQEDEQRFMVVCMSWKELMVLAVPLSELSEVRLALFYYGQYHRCSVPDERGSCQRFLF